MTEEQKTYYREYYRRYRELNGDKVRAICNKSYAKLRKKPAKKRKKKTMKKLKPLRPLKEKPVLDALYDNRTVQTCETCEIPLPIKEFYVHKGRPDRHCKECKKQRALLLKTMKQTGEKRGRKSKLFLMLSDVMGIHYGRTFYVIGNGPSAELFDMAVVKKSDITISVDSTIGDYFISLVGKHIVLSYDVEREPVKQLLVEYPQHAMSDDINYMAILFAQKMGADTIYLVGIDTGNQKYYDRLLNAAKEWEVTLINRSDPEGVLAAYPIKKVKLKPWGNTQIDEDGEEETEEDEEAFY